LAVLKRPFTGANIIELGHNIESGKYDPLPHRYSYNLQNIISRMLSTNPDNRPNTLDILNIPILKIRIEEK
jgi:NIMA (never in mitosis gene a)-related kinase